MGNLLPMSLLDKRLKMDKELIRFTIIACCLGFVIGALFLGYRVHTTTGQESVPREDMVEGPEELIKLLSEDIKMLHTRRTIVIDPVLMCVGGIALGSLFGFVAFLVKASYPDITYKKILTSTWCRNFFWIVLFIITWFVIIIIGQIIADMSVEINSHNVVYAWKQVIRLFALVIPIIFITGRIHYAESLKWIKDFLSTGVFVLIRTDRITQTQKKLVWWTLVFIAFAILSPPWIGYKSHSSGYNGEVYNKRNPVFIGFHYIWSDPDPDFALISEINYPLRNKIVLALSILLATLLTVYCITKAVRHLLYLNTQKNKKLNTSERG